MAQATQIPMCAMAEICRRYAPPRHELVACGLFCVSLVCASPVLAQPTQTRHEEFQAHINAGFRIIIDEAMHALQGDARLKRISHERLRGVAEFTTGNVLYVLLHEMGHAVIDDRYLYVLGREEDAADSFSTMSMLNIGGAFSRSVLEAAAKGWFYADARERANGRRVEYYDAHGLDSQRAYQIVCLMVGSDPDKFKGLADRTKMPEERQGTCQGDYNTASWSWNKALDPYRGSGTQQTVPFKVFYGAAAGSLEAYAGFLRSMRLLETTAEHAGDQFSWSAPITLAAQSCGDPNAHWNHPSRTIVLCYEMAAEFAQLYRDFLPGWKTSTRRHAR
jgi:Putative metallopeptidase